MMKQYSNYLCHILSHNSPDLVKTLIDIRKSLQRITNIKYLLNILTSDYKLKFPITSYQSKPIVSVFSKSNSEIIEPLILDHLGSRAISSFHSVEGQHIYRIFTVKMSNGKIV